MEEAIWQTNLYWGVLLNLCNFYGGLLSFALQFRIISALDKI